MTMSFWNTSEGESVKSTGGEYEVATSMEPIPEGSSVLAQIDEAKWDVTPNGDQFVSLRWVVLAPEAFNNRKVFHKLWVTDYDPNTKDHAKAVAKTDKHRKMLAAIDANAGGKLTAKDSKPTTDDLVMALTNKPMVITLGVWESNTGGNGGNWVMAVAPKTKELKVGTTKPAGKPRQQSPGSGGAYAGGGRADMDDEIPF
jgi:hypothetical protein